MKKYLVIGNPIEHSLSPKLHNYWIKNNNLNAIYDKKRLNENELENLILEINSDSLKYFSFDQFQSSIPIKIENNN